MIFTPIIKVVSMDCNLRCNYCFYNKQKQNTGHLMNLETLEILIKETCKHNSQKADFIWHGGEPLLAGINFFEKVIEFQGKYRLQNQIIINKLQTNGTLINDQWAKFFSVNKFGIGVSLDGPENLNIFRKFPNGKNAFNQTWQGIQILNENNIFPGIIAVINSVNVKHPKELFDFFIAAGLKKILFNHTKDENYNKSNQTLFSSVEPKEYGFFLKKVFDIWLEKNNPTIEIRQIKSIVQLLLGSYSRGCEFTNQCHKFITVEYNGDVYPCDCITNTEKEYLFGNICDGLQDIIESNSFEKFKNINQEIRKNCLTCKWYKICNGGCTRNYLYEPFCGYFKNYFCEALMDVYQHIYNRLKYYNLPVIKI